MGTLNKMFVSVLRVPRGILIPILGICLLPACAMNMPLHDDSDGGIGFREERHAEIMAMREYRSCKDTALTLDAKARADGSASRYLASAQLLAECESELEPTVSSIAEEERMRAYGLSIQNYLKGGDITSARNNLEAFKAEFSGHDLYYEDGSSFIDTMAVLVGIEDRSAAKQFSMANISSSLKAEMRRSRYWTRN